MGNGNGGLAGRDASIRWFRREKEAGKVGIFWPAWKKRQEKCDCIYNMTAK